MSDRLWTPEGTKVTPDKRKWDGGTFFDDELGSLDDRQKAIKKEYDRMVDHLRKRPDHTVYVGDTETRDKMRQVFNHMFNTKVLNYRPDIRIDYGVRTGALRIDE